MSTSPKRFNGSDRSDFRVGTSKRKKLGQFYTPPALVNYILDRLPLRAGCTILDPACGDGAFLEGAYERLQRLSVCGDAATRQLFGIDIDPTVVHPARHNLAKLSHTQPDQWQGIIRGNFLFDDPWPERANAWPALFDFIIGNPPYGAALSAGEKRICRQRYRTAKGKLNTAILFVERALEVLRPGGLWGMVLPNSLLRVASYQPVRDLIFDTCAVTHIADLGAAFSDVDLEMCIVIARKDSDSARRAGNVTEVNLMRAEPYSQCQLPQAFAAGLGTFPICADAASRGVLERALRHSVPLDSIAAAPRGMGYSVRDTRCIVQTRTSPGDIRAIRGRDIARYHLKDGPFVRAAAVPACRPHAVARGKIVMQNIGSRFVAAWDAEGRCALDTVNVVDVYDGRFHPKYVLAVLNSEFAYFFLRDFVCNRSRLTIHLDIPYVGRLPVPRVSRPQQKEIVRMADRILRLYEEGRQAKARELEVAVDQILYGLYGLSDHDVGVIRDGVARG